MFNLGSVVMTKGLGALVQDNPERHNELVSILLERYCKEDWGDLGEADKALNDEAVKSGDDRILARYNLSWCSMYIITEWDRSYTTLMLVEEY